MDFTLPESEGLRIEYFGHLFDNTSECYKMFWFQAIGDSIAGISVGKSSRFPGVGVYKRMIIEWCT